MVVLLTPFDPSKDQPAVVPAIRVSTVTFPEIEPVPLKEDTLAEIKLFAFNVKKLFVVKAPPSI